MRVDLFDFDLPEDRIALRPVSPRDAARLLMVRGARMADWHVRDLPDLLHPGDCLVFNDTRVIPGRLIGTRGEGKVEVTLHKRLGPVRWACFARPAKKCVPGTVLDFTGLKATVEEKKDGGEVILAFDVADEAMVAALEQHGVMPLPPYIASRRAVDSRDREDYQTRFAQKDGAVAAPTASLHFTDDLMARLADRGVQTETLTLHVGAGTFLPVKAEETTAHRMHSEWGELTPAAAERLNDIRAKGGRIIAVGTTPLRLLESAVDDDRVIHPFTGDTDIFITPGYRFRAIDGLMTNFHLPKSTLFMLVSALMGLDVMKSVYTHAIENGYRFYSYGDSSLLLPDLIS